MIPRAVETKVDIKYPLVQISDPPIGNVLAGTASSYLFFNLISAVFMPIWLWLRLLYFMVGYLISWIFIFIYTAPWLKKFPGVDLNGFENFRHWLKSYRFLNFHMI